MTFPSYANLEQPLLRFIYEHGGQGFEVRPRDVYGPLADWFGLSEGEHLITRDHVSGDGNSTPVWNNRVPWARNTLRKLGLLADSANGIWKLSKRGIEAANDVPSLGTSQVVYPDDVAGSAFEGSKRQVQVNAYERSALARQACVEHYGYRCAACGFDFEAVYGERGRLFIHVHHIVPLAAISEEYLVDPIRDLRPICPNCHAIVHRTDPPCSIDELICMLERVRKAPSRKADRER